MTAGFPGVYTAQRKDKTTYFRASITYRSRHISLGSFSTAKSAYLAYTEADTLLHAPAGRQENFSSKKNKLSFEKWIILLNFRDNGIYFPTPIYVRPKFFYYCLSKHFILKFDIDDLFYYSSHKIMKRNGHLFVADYGMQVNILNRYGIKNYAVEGRDFRFVNGDHRDFRYENIEILNQYHGVTAFEKKGSTLYKAKIHVRGNYVIGTYHTPEEAAIAYNKAIDILAKNGVRKQYTQNYLEHITPSRYADIYTSVKISPKLVHYAPTSPNNPQS